MKKILNHISAGSILLYGSLLAFNVSAQQAPVFLITLGSSDRVEMWTNTPANTGDDHGTRIYCVTSHLSYDDPIVYPGQPAAAHLHTFWGNTDANYASTANSLLFSGNSSCEGGINNRTAYWAPTLFDENDQAVLPEDTFVYYKSFGGQGFDRNTIQSIPNGLKMLANKDVNLGGEGNFDIKVSDEGRLFLSIAFPACIAVDNNGKPLLDSPDNISHMSYTSPYLGTSNECPLTHPYRIPEVSYNLFYRVDPDSQWYLSSDHSAESQGDSLHADYFAAWDDPTMNEIVRCNIEERADCEFGDEPGHREQLSERFESPDGEVLYQWGSLLLSADQTPFGDSLKKMHGGHNHSGIDILNITVPTYFSGKFNMIDDDPATEWNNSGDSSKAHFELDLGGNFQVSKITYLDTSHRDLKITLNNTVIFDGYAASNAEGELETITPVTQAVGSLLRFELNSGNWIEPRDVKVFGSASDDYVLSTVYEDAEDGVSSRWYVTTRRGTTADSDVDIIYDSQKQSNVVRLTRGENKYDKFLLRKNNGRGWSNSTSHLITWSQRFGKAYGVQVAVRTSDNVNKFILYRHSEPAFDRVHSNGKHLYFGLGRESRDNTWQTYTRNLQTDLQVFFPDETVTRVHWLRLLGESGRMDDIELIE